MKLGYRDGLAAIGTIFGMLQFGTLDMAFGCMGMGYLIGFIMLDIPRDRRKKGDN